ncbi:ATP-binding cassette domain-containing protein [Niallia sp. 01092]|uniref:ATP-binding cassette domain-containing protein n=1 Tax=unclassified Niallia TaxID=2837522 RepID=UPI003FCFD5CF
MSGVNVKIQGLDKSFGEANIIKNIDLTINKGEFIAIVGKSGCGKSTLLRLIAGLEQPSNGELLTEGKKIQGYNAETRVLFQESRLLPWKKVVENVRVCAVNKNKEDAYKALASVGLEEKGNQWPRVLSGGQKQRVALARALAADPKLLLLDEPLGALDALTRIEMQNLIENLWKEKGFTAILVTHDVSEAVALADRVLLIEEGGIAMDVSIPLARPRIRNNEFIYYEKMILDRVLGKQELNDNHLPKLEYSSLKSNIL